MGGFAMCQAIVITPPPLLSSALAAWTALCLPPLVNDQTGNGTFYMNQAPLMIFSF